MDESNIEIHKNGAIAMIISSIRAWGVLFIITGIVNIIINSINVIPEIVVDLFEGGIKLLVIYAVAKIILDQVLGFKNLKYYIKKNSVEVYSGVIVKKREIIPIMKMQQIQIEQGILSKKLGLMNVNIITAGGEVELKYVAEENGEKLAETLKQKINDFEKEKANNYDEKE